MNRRTHAIRNLVLIVVILTGLFTAHAPVAYATNVGGAIDTDTTWTLAGSPYVVTNSVLVMEGVRLTIEPGVQVRFNPDLSLQVDGELIARGTSGSPIRFTANNSNPTAGDWGYLLFQPTSVDAVYEDNGAYLSGSILQYAVVEYAGGTSVTDNGAIRVNGAAPFIDHSSIQHSAAYGISVFGDGFPKVTYNTITHTGWGVVFNGGSQTAEIRYNDISNNGGGVYIVGDGIHASISNNTIRDNNGGMGIFFRGGRAMISNNVITGNSGSSGAGIYVDESYPRTTTVDITDNTIRGNTARSVYGSSGGGIYIVTGGWTLNKAIMQMCVCDV